MSLPLQAQLLRVVQEGTYKRVETWQCSRFSGSFPRPIATFPRASAMAISGILDLYYRIGVGIFRVPPLRERREDVLPLARHFLRVFQPDITDADFDLPVREYLFNLSIPAT